MNDKSASRKKLLLALLLATVAAAAVYWFLNREGGEEATTVQQTRPATVASVVVTTRDIAPGETIGEADVQLEEIDAAARHPRALLAPNEAVGKVATSAMVAGEQIIDVRVAPESTKSVETFAEELRPGYRAITLSADELVTVGGLAQPGDHADVIAFLTMEVQSPDQPSDAGTLEKIPVNVAAVIAQDVEVFAVAQDMSPTSNASADPASAAQGDVAITANAPVSRPTAASVTLMVTPDQAARLMMAVNAVPQQGALRLVLRSPGDNAAVQTTTVQFDGLVDGRVPDVSGMLDDLVEPVVVSPLVITNAAFQQHVVSSGDELKFSVTVKNISDQTIEAGVGGAPNGFSYTEGEAFDALGFAEAQGGLRIAVGVDGATAPALPYRWSLEKPLAPGESTTINGRIRLTMPTAGARYWFAVVEEPNDVIMDGVSPAEIVVLPAARVRVIASETNLLDGATADAAILRAIPKDAEFRVVTQVQGWYQVEDGGTYGWIAADAVEPIASINDNVSVEAGATPVAAEGAGS